MANIPLSQLTGQQVVQYYDPSGPAAGDMFWSMATSREGCYIANGADYAQADEPELYAAIGTAFNTQINPTTGSAWAAPSAGRFRVPDMRGVVPRGAGTPHNGSALAVGAYEADQMQGHAHVVVTDTNSPIKFNGAAGGGTFYNISGSINTNAGTPYIKGRSIIEDGFGSPRVGDETRVKARGGNWFIRRFNPSPQVIGAGMSSLVTPGLVYQSDEIDISAQISSALPSFAVVRATANVERDRNGKFFINFIIATTCSSGSRASGSMSLAGVTFKNVAGYTQAISGAMGASAQRSCLAYVSPNTSNIVVEHASDTTTAYYASGRVEINAKPSWA